MKKLTLFLCFLMFLSIKISAQISDLQYIKADTQAVAYKDLLQNLRYYYYFRSQRNLGSYFLSMNDIRIGLILHKLQTPDSIVFRYLSNSVFIDKYQACLCFSYLQDEGLFQDLRSAKWTKILRYCDYKKTVYVNKPFINDLHADLATILEYDGRYREKMGVLAFMLGNDAEEALNLSKNKTIWIL